MSSLAAARADNFYFPPDWRPTDGSLNKARGEPPGHLGKRAKKMDQGILVIRFEMPFPVWCSGCSHLIAKGVRFNAEKKAVGAYHSTKIFSFSMKTPCCSTALEIHTDPKACEYVVVRGAERKVDSYSAADAGTVELAGPAEREEARADPVRRLEGALADAGFARSAAPSLLVLEEHSAATTRDDYRINKAMRRAHRSQRREAAARTEERIAAGLPAHIPLLAPSAEDELIAAAVPFAGAQAAQAARRRQLALGPALPGAVGGKGGLTPELARKARLLAAAGVRFGRAERGVFGGR